MCDRLQTFNGELFAEPSEGVLLHIRQSWRINAAAEVKLHGVVLGKKSLLGERSISFLNRHNTSKGSRIFSTHLLPHQQLSWAGGLQRQRAATVALWTW